MSRLEQRLEKPAKRRSPSKLSPLADKIYGQADMRYKNMYDAFRSIDKDKSNQLDEAELTKALASWNLKPQPAELKALFAACDADGDGRLSFAEFSEHMLRMEARAQADMGVGRADRTLDGHHVMTSNMARGSGGGQVIMSDYHYLPRAELEKARAT